MRNKKGFTLVELLVTIGIIGILATVTVVSVGNARGKARDAKRVSDIKQIQSALELAGNDLGGFYPGAAVDTAIGGMRICGAGLYINPPAAPDPCVNTSMYLNPIPADPTNTGALVYKYTATKGGANCVVGLDCDAYSISFSLEGKTGNLAAGPHTATNTGIK
jgi:prepilin-type N-terminal cleavage/methylation domain-containing protein